MFANLLAQVAGKFGLSTAQAEAVVRAALGFLERAPYGLGAVVDQLQQNGVHGSPASWIGDHAPVMDTAKVAHVVGEPTVKVLAADLHVNETQASSILGYVVPKVVGLVAPTAGTGPGALPAAAKTFLKGEVLPPGLPADHLVRSRTGDWLLRGAILACVLALLWWLTPRTWLQPDQAKAPAPAATTAEAPKPAAPAEPATAQAPAAPAPAATATPAPAPAATAQAPATPAPAAQPPAAATMPARLALKEQNGTFSFEGVVPDEATKTTILSALGTAFGADKVKGDLTVDPKAGKPEFLSQLSGALPTLNFPGMDAVFEGGSLKFNALPSGIDRNALLARLSGLFSGAALSLPTLPSVSMPNVSMPNVTVPSVTVPSVTVPNVTVPSVTVPSVSAPNVTLPSVTLPTLPARFNLREVNGMYIYSGAVPDEATAERIKAELAKTYGADKIRGAFTINPRFAMPDWLSKLPDIFGALKSPGFNFSLDGAGLNLRALSPSVDRDKLSATLAGLLPNVSVTLPDLDGATLNAKSALSALDQITGSYRAADVLRTLNEVAIEFPTGSAQVPSDSREVLTKAATLIKALPGGATVAIEGYTDNVGDEASNLELSQKRADAVKDIMIAAGLAAEDVSATGYGSSNPIATNDTPEGRRHNRRITYEVRGK